MLAAGRQADVLVAEALMGWSLVCYETDEVPTCDKDYELASRNDGWEWVGRPERREAWQWRPSTDIADAWEVVARLTALGWVTVVTADGFRDGTAAGFDVEVFTSLTDGHQERRFSAHADTAPLAICRASMFVVAEIAKDRATPTNSEPEKSHAE